FGNIRETMKALDRAGICDRYGLCNTIHDSLVFEFPATLLAQHVTEVYPLLTAPSLVLRNSVTPDGLWCDVECCAGANRAEMDDIKLRKREEAAYAPTPTVAVADPLAATV